ncbi:hypothetical protein F4827_004656 [Paraburkholderia bannensis]|uniref:Uncharacterized protein n=1 Tax=Paraburkholderia bannensis TaxID=765414 RepID=A0A7W9U0F8_9BURK|nr:MULTISPECIES: hypothetical protein [Paraburkholderia]MBB3259899.1 hypothetical protein [Paraburkholderia sp. WP4_3_2]MBB6104791.1 hypothetical protein [Paraburkholderia bannensis]
MASSDTWLVRYPLFREALFHGAMPLGALPPQARAVVAKRVFAGDGAKDIAGSAALHVVSDVRVAYVELPMSLVDQAVRDHRVPDGDDDASLNHAIGETRLHYPRVARPPCLLMPGQGVFLDSWMRFFVYRARGDINVPVLAVDWFTLYERIARVLENERAASPAASVYGRSFDDLWVSREPGLVRIAPDRNN